MIGALFIVNARAADTPIFNQTAQQHSRKDSLGSTKAIFSRLVNNLMATGEVDRMKPGLAQLIGLTGEPYVKGRDHQDGSEYRECSMVYPSSIKDKTLLNDSHPAYVYFNRRIDVGHDGESYWYRVSMEGKLDKAVIHYNKTDKNDKSIPGSDKIVQENIDSPKVKKRFEVEASFWVNLLLNDKHTTQAD